MANSANSPFVRHPALLALFAPRPCPQFRAPMPSKSTSSLTGVAQYTELFSTSGDTPDGAVPEKYETPTEKKLRVQKEKDDRHKELLAAREKEWDPHNNAAATKDPYKTLFVARLSFELTEADLRKEFERYGRIRDIKLIVDQKTQKSRGYAFIEFERSNDLKEAFQHADGHKLKGRRILVDVERGRTVKSWKPRKLGGGLGKTRAGPKPDKVSKESQGNGGVGGSGSGGGSHKSGGMSGGSPRHSSRTMGTHKSSGSSRDRGAHNSRTERHRSSRKDSKYSSRRDKYRDRDYRDRDRRSSRKEGHSLSGPSNRSRSRSRERGDRSKRRSERDRDRERGRYDNGSRGERGGDANGGAPKDRERPRRRRSRSKEKTRRR